MSRTVAVPDWLNKSFLQTVLQHDEYQNKAVTVNSIKLTPAVPPGANYASVLFRMRGKFQVEDDLDQGKEISVIVKALITNDFIGKYIQESGLKEKEYIAYREFLPEIYHVLPKTERFTAKLLYSPESAILVMEDLKDQGFVMADRLKQLDFDHCLVCLKTVAKYHAASVAVMKKNPEFIEKLGNECMYNTKKMTSAMKVEMIEMMKNFQRIFTMAAEKWGGFEDFEEKSSHVWETIIDDVCDVFEPSKDSLNVMNHGDLWTNNMMFKYNSDGNIVDFRLLDFQICRYGTPATDLLYFLFTSTNKDVRENRLDELTSAYLETLNSVLEQLDCEERLTREQLDAELKRCQCYVFVVTYFVLTAVLADPEDLVNLDEVTEENFFKSAEGNPFEKCYYGKYYKEIAAQILRYLDKQRFFEREMS